MSNGFVSKPSMALGLLRFFLGLVFVMHGAQKLFVYHYAVVVGMFHQLGIPAPGVSAALAMAAELGGGFLLMSGLYTRLAAIPVGFTMLIAIVQVHLHAGFFAQNGGFEYPLTLLIAIVTLIIGGSGAFALDNLRGSSSRQAANYRMPAAKAA